MAEVITNLATYERQTEIINAVKNIQDNLIPPLVGSIDHCTGCVLRVDAANDKVYLHWQDPADNIINGITFAQWAQTDVYKKYGSAPQFAGDGTLVVSETTRNQYSSASAWYEDAQADGANWHYRAFPKTTAGYVNVSDKNNFKPYTVYAFVLDETDSDEATCVTYAEDCAGFTPITMNFTVADADTSADTVCDAWNRGSWGNAFFMPKPCMLKSDGTVDYYLDEGDNRYKAGTNRTVASDIANPSYDGNAMMQFPAIFTKVARDENAGTLTVWFSDAKVDADYECYPCLQPDGTYAEYFYLPIFEGTVVSDKLRSIIPTATTKPWASSSSTQEQEAAELNGEGWGTTTWADEDLMRMLGILVTRRLNSQAALGYLAGASTSALTNYVGKGATKGLFYGHTATSNPCNMKFFGMENWWGHRWRRPQGLNLVSGTLYMKLTRSTADGSKTPQYTTSDTAGDYTRDYKNTGITLPTNWNASFIVGVTGIKGCVTAPKIADGTGSDASYFCDATWSASGVRCLSCGGFVNDASRAGLFASSLSAAPSLAYWIYGASLSYHT